jgi:hypothetical protein
LKHAWRLLHGQVAAARNDALLECARLRRTLTAERRASAAAPDFNDGRGRGLTGAAALMAADMAAGAGAVPEPPTDPSGAGGLGGGSGAEADMAVAELRDQVKGFAQGLVPTRGCNSDPTPLPCFGAS